MSVRRVEAAGANEADGHGYVVADEGRERLAVGGNGFPAGTSCNGAGGWVLEVKLEVRGTKVDAIGRGSGELKLLDTGSRYKALVCLPLMLNEVLSISRPLYSLSSRQLSVISDTIRNRS